jgi:hypothetical protein
MSTASSVISAATTADQVVTVLAGVISTLFPVASPEVIVGKEVLDALEAVVMWAASQKSLAALAVAEIESTVDAQEKAKLAGK